METIHKSLCGPGITSPVHRTQEKPQMVDQATQKNNSTENSRMMTRAQKTRTECAQTSGPEGKAGDRIYHLKAQCGRVSHTAGTGLGGHEKVIWEEEHSVDKKGMKTEKICWWLLEEISMSPGCSWPQLCPVDSHDHFPVSTVYISIGRVTTAPLSLGLLSDSRWPREETVTNPQSGHILSSISY